jgi:hypothetical protein
MSVTFLPFESLRGKAKSLLIFDVALAPATATLVEELEFDLILVKSLDTPYTVNPAVINKTKTGMSFLTFTFLKFSGKLGSFLLNDMRGVWNELVELLIPEIKEKKICVTLFRKLLIFTNG